MLDTLTKLEQRALSDPEFSVEDIRIVHEMISAYRGWQSMGRAFKFIVWALASVAGIVAASGIIAGGFKSWFNS
ncbi:hypothetical protein OAA60_00945 [Porticoccaceae bacterium]|jgi:hypothetical protein|nr:hypothetical protein [Porticoccaceae bacterium]|tara:strand:- start:1130 stop:1351 length:222 start_codon:yes stop_codon:yes gene_type:complete